MLHDADPDATVATIAAAAFAEAGQRCTATSRVLVHRSVFADVRDRLIAAAGEHVLCSGLDATSTMGPVVSPAQQSTIRGFVDRAVAQGAAVATPARDLSTEFTEHGCFVSPTVVTDVTPDMEIWRDEIFGPVVSLIVFDTLDEAISVVNGSQYGLAAAIYTSDLAAADTFARVVDVGQVAVNLPTSNWDVQMPFGGFKASGSGH